MELDLELGHVAGATGAAALTEARLEVRSAGGGWKPVELEVTSVDDTADAAAPESTFPTGRDLVTTYSADVQVPDAGGWVDLRVTATDAAGSTFSQEIERAFEVAAVKKGGRH